ncbi:LysR family transcriptional regulator [Sphingopyxis sp. XHP0097]|uniref:LysR family transcriptional regulator n=1 Tax=Sphingopyxis jiangsuensis TaxID=2871171 RepID=A0ABS7MGQ7_9SPHN|nr:LysR family transcriptional regulator [Sphingopyxis jiangsuensis]MBY4638198.1 LysR family transcriptional regulator [Sphingopyxis jiangsuensis]
MQDLNDLRFFDAVVTNGGFAPAGRALHVPKSKLSRRIAALENRLGARLIERSSRRFRVTDIGLAFHAQCQLAVAAADRAEALVEASLSEPRGTVRMSCPSGLVPMISDMLPEFLTLYPKGNIEILAADRPVDVIAERIDVALRVRTRLDTDAALTMRTLAHSRRILIASPALANLVGGSDLAALKQMPTLSSASDGADVIWRLEHRDGTIDSIRHRPRLRCDDFSAVRAAALAGLGVALLPDHACAVELRAGTLVRVLPEWRSENGIVHLVFTTRTGLPPLVRAWIDHLAKAFRNPELFGER